MIDWLVVARSNQYGLTRDAAILEAAIEASGAQTGFATRGERGMLDWILRRRRAGGVLHLERAFPMWRGAGYRNWLVPNQERFPRRHVPRLKWIDSVLAKTRHAQAIFESLGVATTHLGFTSEDRDDPAVAKDWGSVFHLAGGSTMKGTDAVVALWRKHPDWPRLTLVQKAENAPRDLPANIHLVSGYVDDARLKTMQNEAGIHLCPSRSEGWGHHIVEALSVGAMVVTTNAPPMNELVDDACGILIEAGTGQPRHLGFTYDVEPDALEAAVAAALAMPLAQKVALGASARKRYLAIDADFRATALRLFGSDGHISA